MTRIAIGNTAEVYDYGEGKILKLFKEGYFLENIHREFNNSTLVNKFGIPSPKAYEIIPDVMDGRTGIVYEKINGYDLLQEVMANIQNRKYVEQRLESFSAIHKDFINHRSTECISYKDYLNYFGAPDVDSLPDGDFLCHGDFHFGNLLRSTQNPDQIYVIDFMNLCHGPKEYDVARAYVLLTEDNLGSEIEPVIKNILLQAKQESGKYYLNKMGFELKDIEQFLPAIEHCRKKEML